MNDVAVIALIITVWNIIVLGMYGLDKHRAKHGSHRISEKTLIIITALIGVLGALVGMYIFRHKTKHLKFVIGVPLLLVFNIAVVLVMAVYFDLLSLPLAW